MHHVLLMTITLSAPADTPITLDATRQLLLDDHLIASMEGVSRRLHPASKHPANPLLRPTEEWEGRVALTHGSVIRDGDRYRMWYLSGPGISYAESLDGVTWVKPQLGIHEIDGHGTNAVILRNSAEGEPNAIPFLYELFGVRKDTREPDPSRRYKMGFLSIHRDYEGPHEDPFHRGQRRGLGVAGSPDGIHWTLIDNWASEAICDGPCHWLFDRARCRYILFGRTKHVPPEVERMWSQDPWCRKNCWGRAVTRIESADFVHWDITERGAGPIILAPDGMDPVGTEIYSMKVFPYEGVYLGLVQVFHNQPDACYLDVQLAVSRDGVHFTRVADREPFIPLGAVGSWDRFNNSIANSPLIVVGDEVRFYYSGRTYRHGPYDGPDKGMSGGAIGLATVQRDRFVSLQASFDGGTITTKPLELAGRALHLNARSDYGEIVVEMLDAAGRPIARSVPIRTDCLDVAVEWEQPPPAELRSPVALRISLKNALLFAIWCR